MTYAITLIPGDGIGPEITKATLKVLEATGLAFQWDEQLAGVTAIEVTGNPLPDATVESVRRHRIALKGPLTTPVSAPLGISGLTSKPRLGAVVMLVRKAPVA